MRISKSAGRLMCLAAVVLPTAGAVAQALVPESSPQAASQPETPPRNAVQAPASSSEPTDNKPALAAGSTTEPSPAPELAAPTAPRFALDMPRAIAALAPRSGALDPRDKAVLAAFYGERQGAPLWYTAEGRSEAANALIAEMRQADQWGLDPAAYAMPSVKTAGKTAASSEQMAAEEAEISATVLRYARHARGGRVEPLQLTKFLDRKPVRYDNRSVLDQIATAADPAAYVRDLHPQHPQFEALRQKYLAARASTDKTANPRRLLANLEQWRWMPEQLGRFHIHVNVPEYTFRVIADGRVVHTERIIIGKIDTQTPIFSDEMEQVIFHPFWGVPDSIKLNEVLPSLRGNGAVLAKHNLRIQIGGRDVDPKAVNWSTTDIRKAHVFQPPGKDNVLGVVKFRFPNKHDVYMHDTPTKNLFQQTVRTYSHGCMRVQNPVRLAELILAHDKQMTSERVRALTLPNAPENNQINLSTKVPVHITYFTASVDDDGKLKTFGDIYGHEERIGLGLEGKFHLIKPVLEPKGAEAAQPVASLSEQWFGGFGGGGGNSGGGRNSDWSRRAFGNN